MHEIKKRKDLPKECMMFGYGSLMFPAGLRDRDMAHIYTDEELFPMTVEGLRRGMFAQFAPIPRVIHRYYGVVSDPDSEVFGVLFKIHTKDDLIALLNDEYASPVVEDGDPVYELWDISDLFAPNMLADMPKLTLVCKERTDNPEYHAPGYVDFVYDNLPDRWKADFLLTGGIKS